MGLIGSRTSCQQESLIELLYLARGNLSSMRVIFTCVCVCVCVCVCSMGYKYRLQTFGYFYCFSESLKIENQAVELTIY